MNVPVESTRGAAEVGSETKGPDLYLAKRGSNNITSSSVATRANMEFCFSQNTFFLILTEE